MNKVPLSDRALLLQAAELLQDSNLVWSADFESIREPLSALLRVQASDQFGSFFGLAVAKAVLADA